MRIPARGPGRPRKWNSPLVQWRADIPQEDYELAEEERLKLGLSRAEWFHWMLRHVKLDVMELIAKVKHQEEYIKQLEKEKQALLEEREKLLARIERLELELEALKQGRSVRSYQDALKLKELAKNAREGVSWKALCAEVLGLRDEGKIKDLMKLAFVVRKNERNTWPGKFYPKDIAEEFHGWVLMRPKDRQVADIIDYVLYREDTLKAAKGLAVGEAAKEKVPEVKPLKSGPAAERYLEMAFEVIYHEYMNYITTKQGKKAKEFIEEKVPPRLERTFQDIDPADVRRAAFAVLEKHESDWNEAFVSNLRRVLTRILNAGQYARPLEVKADV
ncbi:hypothetical protein E3E26_06890 [Thermococcus sp. LS1]|uniref:hypothetical protein n=1 Tax=Thermococcus sp. LS1 TaxID=1638259 RepID=UPI00143AE8F0|nr:hypothetical protein [Thermococcus sp. LS1]NJD99509.1 hypothetical protein [Thermococcus sp. LS1]